ncbi:YgaP family membrane protein [Spirosoma pulveris]
MKKNLGYYDISLRGIIGMCLLILFVVNDLHSPMSWLYLLFSIALLLTSISGSCPLYRVLNLSTRYKHKPKDQLH